MPLELSKIELRILLSLFRRHPQPTPIQTLKQEAWEDTVVEDGTLNTFFWKLNKKTASWTHRVVKAGERVSLQENARS
jgi:DNA-binding response OmpR family regulator